VRADGSTGRPLGRGFTIIVGALLAVGVVASPAGAAVPGTPAAPSVSAGDSQITVTFSAPASNGGKAINQYTASCTPIDPDNGVFAQASNTGMVAPLIVTGLTDGAGYTCSVHAHNADGFSNESPQSSVVVPGAPATPAQPIATAGHAQIGVSFTPPADNGSTISSYTASCTSTTGVPGSNTGAVSPITSTVLTNGASYTCTVSATNAFGTSAPSPPSTPVTPSVSAPTAPATPTVARGDTKIGVFFSPPSDNGGSPITSYTASCSGSGPPGFNTGPGSPITVGGLTDGATYTCTVTATNAFGTSAPSPPSAAVVPAPVPDAPPQPSVAAHIASITVTFSPPFDNGTPITSYTATCVSSNGGAPAAQSGAGSPITVAGLSNGRIYTCSVTATSAVGTGPPSPASAAVVPTTVPSPPILRAAAPGDGAAVVAFTPVTNNSAVIVSFRVACVSNDGGAPGLASGPKSPVFVPGLSNGKIYTCTVRATNAMGVSGPSAASRAFIVGTPGTPIITHVVSGFPSGSTGALNVTFNPGPVNGSAVSSYRATCTPLGTGVTGANSNLGSPISVAGLLNGHAYSCTVVATNARGPSAASAAVTAIVGTPTVPFISHVLLIRNGVVLPFGAPSNNGSAITFYRAHCTSPNGGVPSTPLQLVSPIVAALTGGRTYTCALAAVNARGQGASASVGPFVVPVLQNEPLASCHGATGSLVSTPGLQFKTAQAHTFALSATLGACTGPYVQKGRITASFHTRSMSCLSAIGVGSGGTGTLTWTAPGGLGNSTADLQFTIESSAGHATLAQFHGTVTSRANLFSNARVGGTVILNRGIASTGSGPDCASTGRVDSFAVTTITMSLT
jgi:hypothetical protein